MAEIIDGKKVSEATRKNIKEEIAQLKESTGITPGLAVVIVGEDPASLVYVRNKKRACKEVGMYSEEYKLPQETTEEELLALVEKLNNKSDIHGILVQSPLPKHIDENKVYDAISPAKDVDVFHPYNVGRVMLGRYDLLPCTPAGVMELLKFYNIDIKGKDCVVIGRSNIVGKPQFLLTLQADATVTVCHSKTANLAEKVRQADIVIAAIRNPKFITADMIKDGAVVIDVGINRDENNKLCGDVDYESVKEKASFITPVPGGVGPMTITMLLKNTLTAAKKM